MSGQQQQYRPGNLRTLAFAAADVDSVFALGHPVGLVISGRMYRTAAHYIGEHGRHGKPPT